MPEWLLVASQKITLYVLSVSEQSGKVDQQPVGTSNKGDGQQVQNTANLDTNYGKVPRRQLWDFMGS